jgi:hypothetical protein
MKMWTDFWTEFRCRMLGCNFVVLSKAGRRELVRQAGFDDAEREILHLNGFLEEQGASDRYEYVRWCPDCGEVDDGCFDFIKACKKRISHVKEGRRTLVQKPVGEKDVCNVRA